MPSLRPLGNGEPKELRRQPLSSRLHNWDWNPSCQLGRGTLLSCPAALLDSPLLRAVDAQHQKRAVLCVTDSSFIMEPAWKGLMRR